MSTWGSNTTTTWAGSGTYTIYLGSPPQVVQDEPYLVGQGPAECSTSKELSVLPVWIHDVNGYYRELGVKPQATRRELREAYQALDGQASARLTYILRQLLDPEIRFLYDCTPLGFLFLDKYVTETLNRRAKAEAAQRMAARANLGLVTDDEAAESVLRDIYAQMGMESEKVDPFAEDFGQEADSPPETLDPDLAIDKHVSSPAVAFSFAYYLWRAPQPDQFLLDRLAEWQRLLIDIHARKGVKTRFAVGLFGRQPHSAVSGTLGYRRVYFLNIEASPTEEVARRVVEQALRTT